MKKRIISLMLVICMFFAISTAAFADSDTVEYTIKAGDTVGKICMDMGLTYSKCKSAILKLNNFASDSKFNNLKVGQVLVFPASDAAAAKIAAANYVVPSISVPEGSTESVTIKAGDTVYNLCKTRGYSYETYKALILKLNNMQSDAAFSYLKVGQTVILPTSEKAAASIASINSSAGSTNASANNSVAAQAAANNLVSGTVAFNLVPNKVQKGDTLYSLCNANGVNFAANSDLIVGVNSLTSTTRILVGQNILLPMTKAPTSGIYYKVIAHVISSGETTYTICQKYGIAYGTNKTMLEVLNKDTNLAALRPGKTLLIPVAATGSAANSASAANKGEFKITFAASGTASVSAKVGGSVVSSANAGDKVTLSYSGQKGYVFKSISVAQANGNAVEVKDNCFTMPKAAVTVTVTYVKSDGTPAESSTPSENKGPFNVYSGTTVITTANAGETVTFTPSPAPGYTIKSVNVTAGSEAVAYKANADGTYAFTMPSSDVSISVLFKKV